MSKYSEIKMDDSGGSQHMSWRAEKDFDAVVKNDKSEKVGNNETHEITNDFKREIHGNQSVTIGANDSLTVGAQSELKVKGSRSVKVGGSESINIGGGEQITSTKGETEKVGAVRLSLVGSIKMPNFKNMAQSAISGLNPLTSLQSSLKNPLQSILSGAGRAVATGIQGGQNVSQIVAGAQTAATTALGNSVSSVLSLGGLFKPPAGKDMEGAGGFLPSVTQLQQMYSAQALQAGLTARVEGALNTATGGLLDSFFPKGQNGQREFKLGWDQADKLIDMFTTGGVSKAAKSSINVIVGGASVKAALGKFEWGAKIAWLETIGGVKYTKTPMAVDQDVDKHMMLTVLGKAKRSATETINIRSDGESSVDVKITATYKAGKTIEINGKDELTIEADSELLFDGGGSTIAMKPGSVTLKGPLVKVDSAKEVFLIGNMLQASK